MICRNNNLRNSVRPISENQGTGRHPMRIEKVRNTRRPPKGRQGPKNVGPASRTSRIRCDLRLYLPIPTSRPYVHPSVRTLFNVTLNVMLLPECDVTATSGSVHLLTNSYVIPRWTIQLISYSANSCCFIIDGTFPRQTFDHETLQFLVYWRI